jgi:hypothetical protein
MPSSRRALRPPAFPAAQGSPALGSIHQMQAYDLLRADYQLLATRYGASTVDLLQLQRWRISAVQVELSIKEFLAKETATCSPSKTQA